MGKISNNLYEKDPKVKPFLLNQVPHSQSSLRENPNFLQNFRHKNNMIKAHFGLIFLVNICLCNYGLALKGKIYYITTQSCVYFIKENSENLRQERK